MNNLAGRLGALAALLAIGLLGWLIITNTDKSPDGANTPSSATATTVSPTISAVPAPQSSDDTAAASDSPVVSLPPPSPLPAGTPDVAQLRKNLQAFVQAYYQIRPSDFDAQGNDNGQRQSRIWEVTPTQLHASLAQVVVDPGLLTVYTQYKAVVHGDVDWGMIDVYSVNPNHTLLNIRIPVTIHVERQNGSPLVSLTLSGANEPASDWAYHNGTWVMTRFTP